MDLPRYKDANAAKTSYHMIHMAIWQSDSECVSVSLKMNEISLNNFFLQRFVQLSHSKLFSNFYQFEPNIDRFETLTELSQILTDWKY